MNGCLSAQRSRYNQSQETWSHCSYIVDVTSNLPWGVLPCRSSLLSYMKWEDGGYVMRTGVIIQQQGKITYRKSEKQLLTITVAPVASKSLPTPLPSVSWRTEKWKNECMEQTVLHDWSVRTIYWPLSRRLSVLQLMTTSAPTAFADSNLPSTISAARLRKYQGESDVHTFCSLTVRCMYCRDDSPTKSNLCISSHFCCPHDFSNANSQEPHGSTS